MKHRAVFRQYKQLPPKKQEAFYESNRAALTLYESAEQYLKGQMNGKTTLPVKVWKAEAAKLAADKGGLYQEYTRLREEVREAEVIRRSVEDVLHDEPEAKRGRTQGVEL